MAILSNHGIGKAFHASFKIGFGRLAGEGAGKQGLRDGGELSLRTSALHLRDRHPEYEADHEDADGQPDPDRDIQAIGNPQPLCPL